MARGNELRQELLNRPVARMYVPRIVITSEEEALQSGWIARSPNNRIIPGPGDLQAVCDAQGSAIPSSIPRPAKPRPQLMIVTEGGIRSQQTAGNEQVTVLTLPYMLYDMQDGKPPVDSVPNAWCCSVPWTMILPRPSPPPAGPPHDPMKFHAS